MFLRNKKVEFSDDINIYQIFSLYDRKINRFYSLVLQQDIQMFYNCLCFTYVKSADNELLKVNKDNLDIYCMGKFNYFTGRIISKVKCLGKFSDLIKNFESKKIKEGGKDGSEDKKD